MEFEKFFWETSKTFPDYIYLNYYREGQTFRIIELVNNGDGWKILLRCTLSFLFDVDKLRYPTLEEAKVEVIRTIVKFGHIVTDHEIDIWPKE